MLNQLKSLRQDPKGRIGIPLLLAFAGMPLGLVFLLWLFFFRG